MEEMFTTIQKLEKKVAKLQKKSKKCKYQSESDDLEGSD